MALLKSNKSIQVAIDGPAGAGKSSVAKEISKKLGILYLDTGAMYRAFAYHVYNSGYDKNASEDTLISLFDTFNLEFRDDKLFLNNEDITSAIRTPEMDIKVSEFASNGSVRRNMVKLQQKIADCVDIVMEGRDICNVVLPNAEYKFYLDANVNERAMRRYKQNLQKGNKADFEKIKKDIIRRDKVDSEREVDPLCVAKDAVMLDSSDMTFDEVVDFILQKIALDGNK